MCPRPEDPVTIKGLLYAIRWRGDGPVVYDPMGALASIFYDPARHFVINPLDARHTPDLQVDDLAGRFVFLTSDPGQSYLLHRSFERQSAVITHSTP